MRFPRQHSGERSHAQGTPELFMPGLHVWSSLQWGGTTNVPTGAGIWDSPDTSPSPLLPIACSPSYNQGRVLYYEHITYNLNRKRKEKKKRKNPPKPTLLSLLPTQNIPAFPFLPLERGVVY